MKIKLIISYLRLLIAIYIISNIVSKQSRATNNNNTNSTNITDSEQCEKKTGILINALIYKTPIPEEYSYIQKFVFYSGYLNNLGDFNGCEKLEGAEYNLVSINIPQEGGLMGPETKLSIRNGICYFKECNTDYLKQAQANLFALVKNYANITIDNATLTITNTKETTINFRENYQSGIIVVIVFICFLIALNVLFCVLKPFYERKHKHNVESKDRRESKDKKKFVEGEGQGEEKVKKVGKSRKGSKIDKVEFLEVDDKENEEMKYKHKKERMGDFAINIDNVMQVSSSVNYTSDSDKKENDNNNEKVLSDSKPVKEKVDKPLIVTDLNDFNKEANTKIPKKHHTNVFYLFLSNFDFFTNAKKILNTETKDAHVQTLRVFDGVRVLSIMWVIFGHGYLGIAFAGTTNFVDIATMFTSTFFPFLASAYFAVDVFFYLSGFLFYIGLQKYLDKDLSKVKIICLAILNRYIRLLPLYLFAIFGTMYLMPYLGYGPIFTFDNVRYFINCKTNWWYNLLYINNFTDEGSSCVGVGWYLANDMQFFIISLVVFIAFNRSKIARDITFFVLFLISMILSIVLSVINNYSFNDFSHKYDVKGNNFNDYYVKPYIRITPYILGLYFAELYISTPVYLKYKKDQNHKKYKEDEENQQEDMKTKLLIGEYKSDITTNNSFSLSFNRFLLKSDFTCWTLFIISYLLLNLIIWETYITNNYQCSLWLHGIFNGFNKVIFVGSLGMILHLTFLGKLSFIYNILSFKVFTPLARITFGIFLIHLYLILLFFYSANNIFYFSISGLGILFMGFFVVSAFLSFFVSLILESPIIGILKKTMGGE